MPALRSGTITVNATRPSITSLVEPGCPNRVSFRQMTDRALPQGTVSFLFSDIEGSTRLVQAMGHGSYTDLLDAHHNIFREAAGNSVISTEGDSFFCVFESPLTAVQNRSPGTTPSGRPRLAEWC